MNIPVINLKTSGLGYSEADVPVKYSTLKALIIKAAGVTKTDLLNDYNYALRVLEEAQEDWPKYGIDPDILQQAIQLANSSSDFTDYILARGKYNSGDVVSDEPGSGEKPEDNEKPVNENPPIVPQNEAGTSPWLWAALLAVGVWLWPKGKKHGLSGPIEPPAPKPPIPAILSGVKKRSHKKPKHSPKKSHAHKKISIKI